jgi:hypothetical protein
LARTILRKARRAALYRSRPPSSALSSNSIRSWRAMKP